MMTENSRVLRTFEPFVLGKCMCNCNEDISIRNKNNFLLKFKHGHNSNGKNHYNWNGGITLENGYWYVYAPDHPYRNYKNKVAEHRLRMEEYLDRYLEPQEEVHHLDMNPENNRIGNLMLFANDAEHKSYERPIDLFNRCCLLCYSKQTQIKRNGRPYWYRYEDGYICQKCYNKEQLRKRKIVIN